jgi:hypothetical protein
MEEFEKSCKELLSDDYMVTSLSNLSKGDFISPNDASQLTKLCLLKWKGCRFTKEKNNVARIVLSPKIVSELEHFLRHPGREGGFNELHPLLTSKGRTKVVFDGSVAESLPKISFLSPTGYWSRFLINKLEREKAISKTFNFQTSSVIGIPKGEYLFFFFEVRIEGFKTEIEFLGLPIEINKKKIEKTDFNSLPRILANAQSINCEQKPPQIEINDFLDIAREYMDKVLNDKRSSVSEDNRYRVESRIAALKKATEIKNKKIQQQMANHIATRKREGKQPDENYIRLTKARIEKEKVRLNSRIEELQERQVLALDYNLDAIAYVKIGDE